MKRLLYGAVLVLVVQGLALAGTSTPELDITSGAATTGDIVGASGAVSYSNSNFAGWDITIIAGGSNSPSLVPFGLDITTLTAECAAASCSTLDVVLSDSGFDQSVTGLTQTYSGTLTGTASTTQYAWVSNSNTDFAETTSLGTLGPFTASFGGSSADTLTTAVSPTIPYSLTLEDTFAACSGTACASYSTDGDITGVPEPASLALLGTGLLLLAGFSRKKLFSRT